MKVWNVLSDHTARDRGKASPQQAPNQSSQPDKGQGADVDGLITNISSTVIAPAPTLALPLPGTVFDPTSRAASDFATSVIVGFQAVGNAIRSIINSEAADADNPPSSGNLKQASPSDLQSAADADGYSSIEAWKQQELQLDSRSNIVKDAAGNLYSVPRQGGPQRRIHECVRLPESDITAMLSVLLDHIRPEQITALLSFVHLSPTARAKGIRTR